jgi:hypothetical protein
MRIIGVLGAIAVLLSGGVGLDAAGATTLTATARVVVRPVTSTGHLATGYTLKTEPTGSVDCSFKDPSPGAVSPNIEFCSPSAEYAIACWNSAVAHRVLCVRDPRSKVVVRIPRIGAFANTPVAPVADRAPLLMKLADGDICSIRDGGAWGSLVGHPDLFGTYSCLHAGVVWASSSAPHSGINESHPVWTIRTAPAGHHALVTRHVERALFVGTA